MAPLFCSFLATAGAPQAGGTLLACALDFECGDLEFRARADEAESFQSGGSTALPAFFGLPLTRNWNPQGRINAASSRSSLWLPKLQRKMDPTVRS